LEIGSSEHRGRELGLGRPGWRGGVLGGAGGRGAPTAGDLLLSRSGSRAGAFLPMAFGASSTLSSPLRALYKASPVLASTPSCSRCQERQDLSGTSQCMDKSAVRSNSPERLAFPTVLPAALIHLCMKCDAPDHFQAQDLGQSLDVLESCGGRIGSSPFCIECKGLNGGPLELDICPSLAAQVFNEQSRAVC
jgi:hypothetical protein